MPIIDKEFQSLIQPLTKDEYSQLEENLIKDGCRDPLVLWDGILIDGHNRLKICKTHNIAYKTVDQNFASREEVKIWIIKNQLGRRNLSEKMMQYYRGKHYEMEKKSRGGDRKSEKSKGQNVPLISTDTADRLGEVYGVNPKTIKRDAKVAQTIDAVGDISPEAKRKILSGEAKVNKKELEKMAIRPPDEIKVFADQVENNEYQRPIPSPKKEFGAPTLKSTLSKKISDLYDTSRPVEYTAEDMEEEIKSLSDYFARNIKECVENHKVLLKEVENGKKIIAALSPAETAIQKLKGLFI